MANDKTKKPSGLETIIGKDEYEKMGNYKEATGGGTPIPKGEKLKDHPEAKRVKQPRDEDGRFTYNAVNFKELKTKESRGKTVPPFLRGVQINFAKKGDKNYIWSNGKRYEVDLEGLDKESFAKTFRKYKGELEDGTLVFGENDKEYKLSPEMKAKAGAYSKAEKKSQDLGDAIHTLYDINGNQFEQTYQYYINGQGYTHGPHHPGYADKPTNLKEYTFADLEEYEKKENTPTPKPTPTPQPEPEKPVEKKDVNSLLGLDDEDINIDESNVKEFFSKFVKK